MGSCSSDLEMPPLVLYAWRSSSIIFHTAFQDAVSRFANDVCIMCPALVWLYGFMDDVDGDDDDDDDDDECLLFQQAC